MAGGAGMKRKRELGGDTCYIPEKTLERLRQEYTLAEVMEEFDRKTYSCCLVVRIFEVTEPRDLGCVGLPCRSCMLRMPACRDRDSFYEWGRKLHSPKFEVYKQLEESDAL